MIYTSLACDRWKVEKYMTPAPHEEPADQAADQRVAVPAQQPGLPFLLLADRAEVLQGKLYVMGGLLDVFLVQTEPAVISFALALAVDIPWNAANEQINIAVIFEDGDGREVARVGFGMMVGRPPQLRPGTTQRVPFAIPTLTLTVPRMGEYVARTTVNDQDGPRVPFRVQRLGQ